jgi:GNAT superfamily N-acetyltransferase
MKIRDAQLEDAPTACDVLRRSITELCIADHGNNPEILTRWLSNKTAENVASWIARPDNSLLVAEDEGTIVAVGSVTDAGHIDLNYVSPDSRFRGVSRSIMRALESRAKERLNAQCTLSSTETARQFYISAGYVETGPPDRKFGLQSGYPMSKDLDIA